MASKTLLNNLDTNKLVKYIKNHKKRFIIIILAILILTMLFRGAIQIPVINKYKTEIDIVKENIQNEQSKQTEVDHLKDIEGSEEWYERKAREKGYIKDNEKVFYDVSMQD